MKTIQVVLDEPTLLAADREARRAGVNRSHLIRRAIQYYVDKLREGLLEEKQRKGYAKHPEQAGEFDAWDRVQQWPVK